jgi:FKBP-type peptidyl-prolyl cis-trans isomerase SlyD
VNIANNTIVSLRYTMHNDNGDLMEDNTLGTGITYMHGSGQLMPALEAAMDGLAIGESKSFSIHDQLLRGNFHFEVFIDEVRLASPMEIAKGVPEKVSGVLDCGPDCDC